MVKATFKVVYIGLIKTTLLWLISSGIYSMRSDMFIKSSEAVISNTHLLRGCVGDPQPT